MSYKNPTLKEIKKLVKEKEGLNAINAGTLNGSRCFKLVDDYGRSDQILRHKADLANLIGIDLMP